MGDITLVNVLAYCAQVACIAAVGSVLPALLRLDVPGVRYTYWRALVALCLALPWLQARILPAATSAAGAGGSAGAESSVAVVGTAAAHAPILPVTWPIAVAVVFAAGIVLRLAWAAAGFVNLRRLRRAGVVADHDPDSDHLQSVLGTRAQIRHVPGLHQPVTFGLFRPVVLLPDALASHPPEIRTAVLAHELVHVQRHDWTWILVEEFVAAALWFHPAMWWLISRVQLAREEVVDELAVTITGRRRTYVEALLAFADSTPLSPAPAFARRQHLFRRMMLVSREVVMSSKRVVASCAVMALVVAGGGWYAVGAFPLQQAGTAVGTSTQAGALEKSAKPITPENPIPRRLQSTAAEYPPEAAVIQARGTIVLRVTLDAAGRVAEARRIAVTMRGGNPAMTLSFTDDPPNLRGDARIEARVEGADAPSSRVIFEAIEAMTRSALAAVRQWSYEPPAEAPISFNVTFDFTFDAPTIARQSVAGAVVAAPRGGMPGPSARPGWITDGAMRVGGSVGVPMKVRDVKPVYPEEAKAARVQGVVIVEARIETDGTVSNARVLRSVTELDQAALDAVMQWKFVPTIVNGNAVPVLMTVTVNFRLQQ